MQKDGSIGTALEIVNEQNALCKTYLKSNDCAKDAKEDRSRAQNLLDPFWLYEQRHDQFLEELSALTYDGTKPDPCKLARAPTGQNQFQIQRVLILRRDQTTGHIIVNLNRNIKH